ncbi:hypothetical protein NP233_g3585 [Leucocoprinus birnbaumii]|uniref:Uncharacterized protein n=1 Tax=Leucocoprinus birnbaumii TaxID=56174 RepID=A0AAD5VXP5_9AGAR|nr:hypothetical protein NP233_g3585 [Leucocoprinus birnbaumii]
MDLGGIDTFPSSSPSSMSSVASSSSPSTLSTHLTVPSTPPSPTAARKRPEALRLNHIGIDPSEIIGKILQRARRSSSHPALTLHFTDNTTYQILVDGYDPAHRGIPKQLEMDSGLDTMLSANESPNLEVIDCALITLQDVAFDGKNAKSPSKVVSWDQKHLGVAVKFSEQNPRWHCIWARMEEYDEQEATCIFRSYDDVYLEKLHCSPKKKNKWRKSTLRRQDSAPAP